MTQFATPAPLVTAAGTGAHAVEEVIGRLGAESVAAAVLTELVERTDLRGCAPAAVLFRLRADAGTVETVLRVTGDGGARPAAPDPAVPVDAVVEQSLPEVVRAAFGPRGAAPAATRVLRWPGADTPETFGRPRPAHEPVRRLLDSIDRHYAVGLAEWCVRSGSDKWGAHQYPQHYERHFEAVRDEPLTLLEIGVGGYADPARGGESLRMWRNYFPRATVFGLDIVDKSALSIPRVTILRGDQSAPADLDRVTRATGPLDIVIDDGSHVSAHVLATFRALFPALRAGGMYVIEDLQTSYWPHFGGSTRTESGSTSTGFLKTLIDGLHHEEINGREPTGTDATIRGLHFYHNLAFIEKGENRDGGAPAWLANP